MEGWAIGAICAEIVVFFLVVLWYIILYVRYTRRPGAHGRAASQTKLYYYYGQANQVYSVDLPPPSAHQQQQAGGPPAPGTAAPPPPSTVTADWLMGVIASDLSTLFKGQGWTFDPKALVLARYDEAARTCINLDLDFALQDSRRGLFVSQTAAEPLALQHRQQQSQAKAFVSEPQHSPASARRSNAKRMQQYQSSATAGGGTTNISAPVPQFHPQCDLISTKDTISITAAAFSYLDFPGENVPAEAARIIEELLRAGEKAVRRTRDGMITITYDPKQRAFSRTQSSGKLILLSFTGRGHEAPRQIVSSGTSTIRYSTIDGEWQPYQGPFRLPRGRWCIQAEATSADGVYVRSSSHVYSVEEDFTSL